MKDYLQINHVSGEGDLWILSRVDLGDAGLLDLLLDKPWRGTESLMCHIVKGTESLMCHIG